MIVKDILIKLQELLLIPADKRSPNFGPLTRAALERLRQLPPDAEWDEVDSAVAVSHDLAHIGEDAKDISEKGEEFVKSFEGLYLKAYDDGGGVWTIGWGHTGLVHEDGTVYPGRMITEQKAEQLFRYDMEQFEARVCALVKVPLNTAQYDALVSFDFNTGGLTLQNGKPSTLSLRLNASDYLAAADELLKWDKDNGKVVAGLTRRRKAEREMFLHGTYIS